MRKRREKTSQGARDLGKPGTTDGTPSVRCACVRLNDTFPGVHRKRLRRHEVPGTARFLTFSCFRRYPLLKNDAIKSEFVRRFSLHSQATKVDVLAWVVMPNHAHLLIHSEQTNVAVFLQQLKGQFAQAVIRRWRGLNAPVLDHIITKNGPRFWQVGGGYDRNVMGDELLEKVRYCHANPVRACLASKSVDWPWSSARRYEARADATGP
jgi:putative transposase